MKITVSQLLVVVILVAVIAIAAFLGADKLKGSSNKTRQSVFLTNGQVYFGYITSENGKNLVLKDIYYLQVQQPLQPAKDEKEQQPQISLVKLGNELHGPKDEMRINREHVLFIEDMKNDSKVNQAIEDFIKNGGKAPTPAPSPAS